MLDVTGLDWIAGTDVDFAKIHEDKGFIVNGRQYEFAQFTHAERKKITETTLEVVKGKGLTPCAAEFASAEALINAKLMLDGVQVSKRDGHWERYPEDFMPCMLVSLQAIAHPFFASLRPR